MSQPVFVLGAGRCGSTLIQRVINSSDRAMIWGEHGGLLKYLANMHRHYMRNEELRRNLFDRRADFIEMAESGSLTKSDSAWFNLFDRDDLKSHTRDYIDALFRSRLPSEVTHWGFKEIRYGADGVVDMLMELYPNAKLVFSFREPFASIESMVLNWSRGLFGSSPDGSDMEGLRRSLIHHAERWARMNTALLESRDKFEVSSITVLYEAFGHSECEKLFIHLQLPCPAGFASVLDRKISPLHEAWRHDLVKTTVHSIQEDIWNIVKHSANALGYVRPEPQMAPGT